MEKLRHPLDLWKTFCRRRAVQCGYMDSLGKFLAKRYGYAGAFALPIILGAIGIGVLSNILEAQGVSQEVQDGVSLVAMLLLILVSAITIIVRKPLPGVLGSWQRLWNNIPTWRSRFTDRS